MLLLTFRWGLTRSHFQTLWNYQGRDVERAEHGVAQSGRTAEVRMGGRAEWVTKQERLYNDLFLPFGNPGTQGVRNRLKPSTQSNQPSRSCGDSHMNKLKEKLKSIKEIIRLFTRWKIFKGQNLLRDLFYFSFTLYSTNHINIDCINSK